MCVGADRASPFTNPVQSRAGSAALFLEPSHQAAGQLATASQIEMFSHFLFRLLPVFGGAGAWLQPFCHVSPPDVLQNHREGKRDEWRHWKKRETTDFFCFLQYTWITCPEINGPIQSQFWGKWQKLIKVNRFTVTEMKQFCLCCFFFLELIDVYFSILSDLFRSIWTLPFESGWKNIYGNLHLIWTKDFFNLLEELKEKKKDNTQTVFILLKIIFSCCLQTEENESLNFPALISIPPRLKQNVLKEAFEGIITVQLLGRARLEVGAEIRRHNLSPYEVR